MKSKRIMAGIIAGIMVTASMPCCMNMVNNPTVIADAVSTEGTYENLTYNKYDNHIEITDCDKSAVSVDIPDEIDGLPVTSIGYSAFSGCTGLTEITIPDSVTSIEVFAFSDCANLIEITIPDSVISIGGNAFNNTAWYENQPDGLVYVGNVAYKYKGDMPENTSIKLKEETTSISAYAFSYCTGLTEITIPDSVISIEVGSFFDCTGLTAIIIPNSVTKIDGAFKGCKSLTEIIIPDNVTSIGENTFADCTSLTAITIPDSVTSIEVGAFSGCTGLKAVTIPCNVTLIGDSAFVGCTSLTEITIPESVTSIGRGAFYGCTGLTEITIPDSVTSIMEWAFHKCSSLKEITILNPECIIADDESTISSRCDESYNYYFDGIIYGYDNSTAQAYAENYGRNFVSLGAVPDTNDNIKGDANNDGVLDVADVVAVASYVGNPEANKLDEQCIKNADVHNTGDGLTANDALMIQQYLAKIINNL